MLLADFILSQAVFVTIPTAVDPATYSIKAFVLCDPQEVVLSDPGQSTGKRVSTTDVLNTLQHSWVIEGLG